MIVIPGRIPIAIHPFFWIFAALIGWMYGQSLLGMAVWIGIIFISVLFHEFGHALTALAFKQEAKIQLIALGGLTSYEGPKLKFWQQFLIVFNGPLFGFLLALFATLALQIDAPLLLRVVFRQIQIANFFWSAVNLLPVLPLDGGQLLRIALEAIFGLKGFRAALGVGALIAFLLSFYFFIAQAFLIGAFFFLFAFQSFDSWRKSRFATNSDRAEENKQILMRAEEALQEGKKEEAKHLFQEVREKASGGLLSSAASQYLAFLLVGEEKHREAYDLLLPLKEHLTEEGRCLLHQLAAEFQNHAVVAELSSECYQTASTQEVALRSARAFAYLKQPKLAGGWLQTAWKQGGLDLERVLNEEPFTALGREREFLEFVEGMRDEKK